MSTYCPYCDKESSKPLTDKVYSDGTKFDDSQGISIKYLGNIPMLTAYVKEKYFASCNRLFDVSLSEEDTKNLASQWATEINYCPKCGRKLRKAEKSIKGEMEANYMSLVKFGERLKQIRETKELSREEIAKQCGVTAAAIGNYENDYRFPNFDILVKIANVLDISTDYLLGNTVERPDTENAAICADYTGLSSNIVEELHKGELVQTELIACKNSKILICVLENKEDN